MALLHVDDPMHVIDAILARVRPGTAGVDRAMVVEGARTGESDDDRPIGGETVDRAAGRLGPVIRFDRMVDAAHIDKSHRTTRYDVDRRGIEGESRSTAISTRTSCHRNRQGIGWRTGGGRRTHAH